ncbi:hydrolase 76 protein [Saxophila tyrrhenica]|uniref:mannan endo-1,6-alpha-mannosidase n=1 Tax=Saxophila tyrrhenica TaxID=1690608 RepID=A0AAV9P6E2_9PEZI|nr:hydrolase 76 protein [Saxophila tyrrhenica]
MRPSTLEGVAATLALATTANALQVDVNNVQSISTAAKTIASNIISYYEGNSTASIPGLFPQPYYFWEGGLAWDSLINYWAKTGDDTYNDRIAQAMLWQVGSDDNYMPANQTKSLGNDDQSFWALAAMTAAENDFPAPKASLVPGNGDVQSWVQLAQNVFDTQVPRWDAETCGGGLRWQIYSFNNGYDYKNTASNGNFMQLAARLAKYTGNSTYSDWATKAAKWTFDVGLIANESYYVYDGATTSDDCKDPNKVPWTGSAGTYLSAYSYLSNVESSSPYTSKILDSALKIFTDDNDILEETACMSSGTCNTDQYAFRAIFARALANLKYVDSGDNIDTDAIDAVLKASAEGAAAQCTGGPSGKYCGTDWSAKFDGTTGLGQELGALEILLANIPSNGTQTASGSTSSTNSTGTTPGAPSGTSQGAVATGEARLVSASTIGLLAALAMAVLLTTHLVVSQALDMVAGPSTPRPLMASTRRCPICLDTITNPESTLCGHVFCAECLDTFLEPSTNPCCPICRRLTDAAELEDPDQAIAATLATYELEPNRTTELECVDRVIATSLANYDDEVRSEFRTVVRNARADLWIV